MKKQWLLHWTFASFVLSLLIRPICAQQNNKQQVIDGRGYFALGTHYLDFDKFNITLARNGYKGFFNHFLSIGGGGFWRYNRFLFEGEGHVLLENRETFNTIKSTMSGGFGLANIGFAVISKSHFNLYPLLGAGYGGLTLTMWDESAIPSFNDIMNEPWRTVEIYTGGFLFNLGAGFDIMTPFFKDERGEGGPCLGFRMGYLFASGKNGWCYQGNKISGGPQISLDGFYMRLFVGSGGRSFLKKD